VPAALVATIGLTLVLEPWNAGDGVLVGGALGAISAFAYAGNVFVVRRLAPRIGVARVISLHSLGAALVLAPLAAGGLAAVSADDLTRLIGGSLILGALAGAMFVRGLSRIGSARASVLTFLEPMVACVVGGLYWHEPVGRLAILGALLIIAAGIHVARAPHRLGAGGTVA
jgi:drug/metabolite transporter (DMT)-like permease